MFSKPFRLIRATSCLCFLYTLQYFYNILLIYNKIDATYSYLLLRLTLLSLSSHVFISQCFLLHLAFACLFTTCVYLPMLSSPPCMRMSFHNQVIVISNCHCQTFQALFFFFFFNNFMFFS